MSTFKSAIMRRASRLIVDSNDYLSRTQQSRPCWTLSYLHVCACNSSGSSEQEAIDATRAPPYIRDTLSTIDEVGCTMLRATRPRLRSVKTLGLATVALAIAAAGCSSGANSGGGTSPGGGATSSTLVIANAVRVDTLDPASNSVNESIWMDQNLYSRLLQPNPTGTGLVPDLATSWDVSKDGLTYTFHLRDAQFSDGTPVTATDVAYSLIRSRNYKGGWGFLLTPVKTITAPDPQTVVITLSQKHAPLLADLAMYAYSIVPKKLVQSQGKAFFQHPVSSGPFYVTSYKADSEIDLARSPRFYGTKPKISKVKIMIVPDEDRKSTRLNSSH